MTNYTEKLYKSQTGLASIITLGHKERREIKSQQNSIATYAETLLKKFSPKEQTEDKTISVGTNERTAIDKTNKTGTKNNNINNKDISQSSNGREYKQNNTSKTKTYQRGEKTHKQYGDTQYVSTSENKADTGNTHEEIGPEKLYLKKRKLNEEEKLLEKINMKLKEMKQEQDRKQRELERRLTKSMGNIVETKIEAISRTVAIQVATQLTEVFKNFLPSVQQVENPPPAQLFASTITQEVSPGMNARKERGRVVRKKMSTEVSPTREDTKENWSHVQYNTSQGRISLGERCETNTNSTRGLSQALNEIETNTKPYSLIHDKLQRVQPLDNQ